MKGIRFFRTIQGKLIIMYVLLILFAMQLIGIYFIRTMEDSLKNNFFDSLNKQSNLFAEYVGPYLMGNPDSKIADLNNFVSNFFKVSDADIQVIDANGVVLSSSQQNAQLLVGQKNTKTSVSRALQNIRDNDTGAILLDTDGKRKKVVTIPVSNGGKVIGAVYIVASMEEVYDTIQRINRIFLSGTLIALALTAFLSVILSHTITSPIKEITKQVTSVADGKFDQQLKVRGQDEIGQLSNSFNYMTERLREALSVNQEEKDKLASILTNMSDGVIATDEKGKVIVINHRAKQMLQLIDQHSEGKFLYDLLGMTEAMITPATTGEENTSIIEVGSVDKEEGMKVRVTFTSIHRREKGVTGTIVVLQDVTEQEELERARREFVANVSHELRTPLTTIKSYLEALEDGALDEPQTALRFVGVTRTETERMIRLVTDLLHLSRLDSKQSILKKESTSVSEMLEEVADRFAFQLQQRKIHIRIVVETQIRKLMMDRDKIDQVLDNLVSNAIKYTGDGGEIDIFAGKNERHMLEVSVKDNGVGIPKKDLSRIFERFYRVDKARSRNMGGTGLGLSIAREIVKAHGGSIMLESEYNQGTKVSFTLPYQLEGGDVV